MASVAQRNFTCGMLYTIEFARIYCVAYVALFFQLISGIIVGPDRPRDAVSRCYSPSLMATPHRAQYYLSAS